MKIYVIFELFAIMHVVLKDLWKYTHTTGQVRATDSLARRRRACTRLMARIILRCDTAPPRKIHLQKFEFKTHRFSRFHRDNRTVYRDNRDIRTVIAGCVAEIM